MKLFHLVLTLLSLSLARSAYDLLTPTRGEVWPKPRIQQKTDKVLQISPDIQYVFNGGLYCEIIEKSFQRHYPFIVGAQSSKDAQQSTSGSGVLKVLEIHVTSGCYEIYPTSHDDHGYTLDVQGEKATLTSEEVWGALSGIETFTQLAYTHPDTLSRVMNETSITDFARFQFRGFLIDTSRHYLSLDQIKLHIDAMEAVKYNVLHWHIVDDPSFPFESQVYPDLSKKGAFKTYTHVYTYSDIHEIIEYARLRGIRVMPEFDTPGHTQSWGVGYPELLSQCIDELGEKSYSGPLEPMNNYTYEFITKLFEEVVGVFPDEALFLGGDEVSFDCWKSNPAYLKFIQQENLSGYAGLEGYYIQKLLQIVKDLSEKLTSIVWQEVYDNVLQFDKDTIVNVWKSGGYEQELARVTNSGYKVILSAPWYLNYISYGEDWKPYYQVEPLAFASNAKQQSLFQGCEACMWGEYVDNTNFLSRTWPRAAAVAERAWSSENVTDIEDAERRMSELRCRLIQRGIPAEPFAPGFCDFEWQIKDPNPVYTPHSFFPKRRIDFR